MGELQMNSEGLVPERRRMGPIEEEVLLMSAHFRKRGKRSRSFS